MANNPWVDFVRRMANEMGVHYGCALAMPEVKEAYRNKQEHLNFKMVKRVAKYQKRK